MRPLTGALGAGSEEGSGSQAKGAHSPAKPDAEGNKSFFIVVVIVLVVCY